jgi:ABC transporter substrate binding protein
MSYGPDTVDIFRRSSSYVDRILKGERVGNLPVQSPDKFELAVNLKTARALGLSVRESFLLLADERTWPIAVHMSACDPKWTLAWPDRMSIVRIPSRFGCLRSIDQSSHLQVSRLSLQRIGGRGGRCKL